MDSTDNSYLLLALNHGFIALALFLSIIAAGGARLAVYGARRPRDDPGALLAFTLLGCLVVLLISLATVYHGEQTVQLFALITGWSDGLVRMRQPVAVSAHEQAPSATLFALQRVMT